MFTFLKILLLGTFSILIGQKSPFTVGEILNYSASFSGIKAGTGSLKIINEDENSFHIQFRAKTNKITNYVFPINDIIDTEDVFQIPVTVTEQVYHYGVWKKSRFQKIDIDSFP